MGTKTIGLDDEAYERLKAQKREGESFSDTVKRITEEVSADWRRSFGRYAEEGERFEQAVVDSRERSNVGLAKRQGRVNEILQSDDETAR
ncbi:antitoxin VapB family protein [Halalkalicoccus salilacus]|uniref:antitoxin VapB family protein n=1 Tax=Halalkalicoccus TaxID=332246 RepID=UPI002F96A935